MSAGSRCVRRTVVAAAIAVVATATVALLPVVGIIDAALALTDSARRVMSDEAAPLPRRWRLLRLGLFLVVYAVVDLAALVIALAVGLSAGRAGPTGPVSRSAHYGLLRRALDVLVRVACPLFGVRVEVTAPETDTEAPPQADGASAASILAPGQAPALPSSDAPVLVLCRHAGPGDSFLLVHALLSRAALRPFVVLKDSLRLDPALDLILSRLPSCFLTHDSSCEDRDGIAALAASAGPGDAVVLFPEGGNFTRHRRARALRHLRRTARPRLVAEATRMGRVLPPRTTGPLAALTAASTADVVFVAHTGLDAVLSPGDVWHRVPLDRPVRVTWWTVPAADIPSGDQAREDWLFAQWRRVDAWIAHHSAPAPARTPRRPPHPRVSRDVVDVEPQGPR